MLDKLQKTEKEKLIEPSAQNNNNPQVGGYNIFKNSIRQIDNIEEYKKREK